MALPLEEGDVVAISSDVAGDNEGAERKRLYNFPLRIEESHIEESPFRVGLLGRKYSTSMYADDVDAQTVPLVTGTEF